MILSRHVPVCTDLLTIGDGTVVRKDSFFTCYRAHAGVIRTGRVTIGRDVVVGEMTVLDIDTSLGDGAQLGHSSSLHGGQAVPAGEHWHGSPAQRTEVDYRTVEPRRCGTLRRVAYSVLQLLTPAAPVHAAGHRRRRAAVHRGARARGAPRGRASRADEAGRSTSTPWSLSAVLFFGPASSAASSSSSSPGCSTASIEPDRVYRLYGVALVRSTGPSHG